MSSLIGPERAKDLSDIEIRAINFAAEHDGKIKSNDAMKLMSRPRWGSANNILKGLEEKGILRFVSRYPRDPTAYFILDVR